MNLAYDKKNMIKKAVPKIQQKEGLKIHFINSRVLMPAKGKSNTNPS